MSDFECIFLLIATFLSVHQILARFAHALMYGVGSVGQDILLGNFFRLPTVKKVTRHNKTANPIRVCSVIDLDEEWYLTRFYWRLWGLQCTEISSLFYGLICDDVFSNFMAESRPVQILKYVIESGGWGKCATMFYGWVKFCKILKELLASTA